MLEFGQEYTRKTPAARRPALPMDRLEALDAWLADALAGAVSLVDPEAVVPRGLDGLRSSLEQMIEVGASKFVVLPFAEPDDWTTELEQVAAAVFPLQN